MMEVRVVPASRIAEDYAAVSASQETASPLSRSQRFNTNDHTHAEIVEVIPEGDISHENPPWTPYSYTLWQPLIAKSQGMANSHVLHMPSILCDDLILLHSSWIASDRISSHLLESILEDLESTRTGRELMSLLDGKQRWFIRLDQMSPKDSPLGGDQPSTTAREVITKIASSMRAGGCLKSAAEREERSQGEKRANVQLILNPWNEKMDPAREFRVFVPPPAARGHHLTEASDFRISAISQYRWYQPLQPPPGFTTNQVVEHVTLGARDVLSQIAGYGVLSFPLEITAALLKYGFTFDVALQDDGSVQLVELNPFGAMSGCGACLFNWILDARILYSQKEAEFAIVLDEPVEHSQNEVEH